jgi:capsular exopolysaccharide synthesis family protein
MSYIFDGLQRAEAERIPANKQGSLAAIELLERAERQAIAQCSSELLQKQPANAEIEHHGPLLSDDSFEVCAQESDLTAITRGLRDEEGRQVFSQFQNLETESSYSRLVCVGESDSPATEAFHLLGVRLRDLRRERELKRLLITSTVPQEGKSVVAANLACTLGSGARQKVLLLEGDVRRPTQGEIFGLAQVPGLCNFLLGKRSLTASLYHLPKAGIWILPAGDNQGRFRELIQSPQLPTLMTTLGSWFDWIVIDSPPVLPLIDTSVWAQLADGILLVARRGMTRKRKLQKGVEALDSHKVIGALLNSSRSAVDGYDYYYGYGHSTGASRNQGASRD